VLLLADTHPTVLGEVRARVIDLVLLELVAEAAHVECVIGVVEVDSILNVIDVFDTIRI
jgi:hypothetical protein